MPILNLAEEVARYLPGGNRDAGGGNVVGAVAGAGLMGGLLGSILGGDD
jgi:hypothetical protein